MASTSVAPSPAFSCWMARAGVGIHKLLTSARYPSIAILEGIADLEDDWSFSLIDLLAQKKIELIVRRMPRAEAARAHELIGKAAVKGKLVLTCST